MSKETEKLIEEILKHKSEAKSTLREILKSKVRKKIKQIKTDGI